MSTLTISKDEEKKVKALGFLNNKGTDAFSGRVITRNGVTTADEMRCMVEAAEKYGNGNLTLTTRLTVECQGIPFEQIENFRNHLATAGLETGGTGAKVRPVTACKGSTCQYGLIDTFGLSREIHERFYVGHKDLALPHKFKIAVGGCPNNCMKPNLNDLGIIGQWIPVINSEACKNCKNCGVKKVCGVEAVQFDSGVISINREKCKNCGLCIGKCPFDAVIGGGIGYQIVIGGRWGKQIAIGKPLNRIFTDPENVLNLIEKIIFFYKEQGLPKERFAQTIARLGFVRVEAMLLGD
ncbi:4Fe-4S binding protein [Acetobacterium carbinolicum]|uniref:4Fe-4S binding protein n=1 Tax=Acetobacterium carbinolicum TaxID=52690 RepID=UPI0039BFABD5